MAIGREGKGHRPINEATLPLTAAMAAKMKTQTAREAYRRRKSEPPNGWIKNVLGFRQFSMRGLHRVQAEWKLVCMALNLRICGGWRRCSQLDGLRQHVHRPRRPRYAPITTTASAKGEPIAQTAPSRPRCPQSASHPSVCRPDS